MRIGFNSARSAALLFVIASLFVCRDIGVDTRPTHPASAVESAPFLLAPDYYFEPNRGQAAADVNFLSRGPGYTVALSHDGVEFSAQATRVAHRLRYLHASPDVSIEGFDAKPGTTRYIHGADPRRWLADLPTYAGVKYRGLYEGIDLVYHYRPGGLEYDFIVAPGRDPSAIRMQLDGAAMIDPAGALRQGRDTADLRHAPPLAYQDTAAGRRYVPVRFHIDKAGTVGFAVAAYDADLPLIIDPVLSLSGFFGGAGVDNGRSVAVDSAGNLYVTGLTVVNTAAIGEPEDYDILVRKYSSAGVLVETATIGGSSNESGHGLTLGPGGEVYIVGTTISTDFPAVNAVHAAFRALGVAAGRTPATDAFLLKLDTNLALQYATYLGGSGSDSGRSVTLDTASGDAYITGTTASDDFRGISETAIQRVKYSAAEGTDAFVARIDANGDFVTAASYLGGSRDDSGAAIVYKDGALHVTGTTQSPDLLTGRVAAPSYRDYQAGSGACRYDRVNTGGGDIGTVTPHPCRDLFLVALTPALTGLSYGTYLGGEEDEFAADLALDSAGNIYLAGSTLSRPLTMADGLPPAATDPLKAALEAGFPRVGVAADTLGDSKSYEAFVSVFKPGAAELMYSTMVRGSDYDVANAIAVTGAGEAYLVGHTWSVDFPLAAPIQATLIQGDAYLTKLAANGTPVYSTYLGGRGIDYGYDVAITPTGVAATGGTWSEDFPTAGLPAPNAGNLTATYAAGYSDGFLAMVSDSGSGVDLAVNVSVDREHMRVGDRARYLATAVRQSGASAGGVRLAITAPPWAHFEPDLLPANCDFAGSAMTCTLADFTTNNLPQTVEFEVRAAASGTLGVNVGVMSVVGDDDPTNNNAAVQVEVERIRRAAVDPMTAGLASLLTIRLALRRRRSRLS